MARLEDIKYKARQVNKAFLDGNRFLDSAKEYVYMQYGMNNFSRLVHGQAHKYLDMLDKFAEVLHACNIEQVYPDTPELAVSEELNGIESVLKFVLRTINNVQECLVDFVSAADGEYRNMAILAEGIIAENSGSYHYYYELLSIYKKVGDTLFDLYVKDNGGM